MFLDIYKYSACVSAYMYLCLYDCVSVHGKLPCGHVAGRRLCWILRQLFTEMTPLIVAQIVIDDVVNEICARHFPETDKQTDIQTYRQTDRHPQTDRFHCRHAWCCS